MDSGAAFTGGTGNDTFEANYDFEASAGKGLHTLGGLDILDGGAGVNTLKITDNSGAGFSFATGATLKNIQNITIAGDAKVTADITGATISGVESLAVTQAAAVKLTAGNATGVTVAGATGAIEIDGGKNVAVTDVAIDKDITIGATTKGAAGTVTITDSKVGKADIKVNGGTDVTINATGSDATGGKVITVGAGGATADLPTGAVKVTSSSAADVNANVTQNAITVKGGATVEVIQAASSTKVAANTTGTVTVDQGDVIVEGGGKTTSVTVNQAASTQAVQAGDAVAGVTETASAKFTALTVGQTITLGGLTFTAKEAMTKEEAAAAFANLIVGTLPVAGDTQSGGPATKGTYTGAFTGWTSGAANGDTVVFTSTDANKDVTNLANTGSATVNVTTTAGSGATTAKTGVLGVANGVVTIDDHATTASITTVSVNGYAEGSSIGKTNTLSKLTTLSLANSGHTTAGTKTGDMTVNAAGVATLGLTLNNIQGAVSLDGAKDNALTTLNVTTAGADSTFALTAAAVKGLTVGGSQALNLTGSTLTALENVTVKGTAGLNLGAVQAAKSIDTTATTGAVTATIDGTKATYTGGAGVDTVTLATGTALTKAIDLGAGDDTLIFGAAVTGSSATLSGGTGTNTLSMTAANAASLDDTKQSFYTNFQKLTVNDAGTMQTLDLANLGFTNYVTTTGGTLTLDKLASGGTVVLSADTTTTTVQVTDAGKDGNTSDVLNVNLSKDGSLTGGTLTAANVETINIDSTDSNTVNGIGSNSLTLVATSATKITVGGNASLNLTNAGNIKVAEIDASSMTGGLTVQAAGAVATTIKGGQGANVLTASGAASGGTAQVSTITLTDGDNKGLDDNDTLSVIINGKTFTYTADNVVDMDTAAAGLVAEIKKDAAYNVAGTKYDAGTDTITVTAAVAGTPFTLSTYAVTDVANDVNAKDLTETIKNDKTVAKNEVHTIAITKDDTKDSNETVDIVFDTDGSAGNETKKVTVTLTDAADATVIATDVVGALTKDADFTKVASATVDKTGQVVITYTTDTFTTVTATADGTINGLKFDVTDTQNGELGVATLTVDTTATVTGGAFNKGDTVSVDVDFDGIGVDKATTYTYTVKADAGEDIATVMSGLTKLIDDAKGSTTVKSAAYNAGVLTVTDAISVDANGVTLSNFKVVDSAEQDNATGSKGVFATTTANVTAVGDTLIGNKGNDTLKSGAAITTMTGNDGQDLFVVNVASTNVNAYSVITDFTASDLLKFNETVIGFKNAAVTLGSTAVFQDYANAAMNTLAAGEAGWFKFGGDTYVVLDVDSSNSTTFINGEDMIVKLTGTVDLTNASFNSEHGTIAL